MKYRNWCGIQRSPRVGGAVLPRRPKTSSPNGWAITGCGAMTGQIGTDYSTTKRKDNVFGLLGTVRRFDPHQFARIQHGAIVPCTHDHGRVGGQHAGEVVDQVKLVHNAPTCCENSSLAKLNALNSMWAVMGASKLFVRSYSTVNTRARTASGKKVARFMWIAANSTAVPHNASRGCPACLIAG